jgi:Secretion system C-terminal sorting domain
MKNKKIKTYVTLLFCFGITLLQAQQATTATGGSASGTGGTATYSVGQVVYITNSGSNGTVAQGVQQAFEISVVLGNDDHTINLEMVAYPNPTTNYLNLNVGERDFSTLNFELFDITGKVIESKKITNTIETIRMEHLPNAVYFLRVTNNYKPIKTFKIIKAQ